METWQEITEEEFNHFMNVLPPLLFDGDRFLMCEPLTHNDEGYAIYTACWEYSGKHYARHMTRKEYRDPSNWTLSKKD